MLEKPALLDQHTLRAVAYLKIRTQNMITNSWQLFKVLFIWQGDKLWTFHSWKFRFSREIFCLVTLARSCITWIARTNLKIQLANQNMKRGREWKVLIGAKRHFCTQRSLGTVARCGWCAPLTLLKILNNEVTRPLRSIQNFPSFLTKWHLTAGLSNSTIESP